ncbi:copper-binding protein [Providencia burhodogranariea]|uniref:Periplasmic copper-binding protein n=1 Tax=Providencia burhodogranariea DSM 19968 TaxID=1141662 RepID=K8W4I7_9GAMM|nr:copper-binding protein [Providencia burhodogranariea]EKT55414.1 periplasmic copper-binding protein [Providencia burhodogranariea DSM 19968]
MKTLNKAVFVLSITFFSVVGYANTHEHNHSASMDMTKTVESVIDSKGKLISIDTENKKLTINHDAIPSIGWPPMTMRFTYENDQIINGLKDDDEVKFSFIQQGNISLLKSVEKTN